MTAPVKITAAQVRAALQARYTAPRYALLFEVTDATGARHTRSADALAMGCWPSMGLELEGMEIKVSRSDWRSELKKPQKAETIASYCDRWWLVTAPGVVQDEGEVPPAWGWMVWDGKRLVTARAAAKQPEPKPVNRDFLAALLRRAAKTDDAMVAALVAERMAAKEEEFERRVLERVQARTREHEQLKDQVRRFTEASGVDLMREDARYDFILPSDGQSLGRAVKMVLKAGVAATYSGLEQIEEQLTRAAERIATARREAGVADQPKPEPTVDLLSRRRTA